MIETKINDKTIRVLEGDITARDTVAIVNAANNRLWMGAGVAGAIKRKGGQVIEDEAVALCPIPVGEAAVTGAGSLPQKYVIHAAGMGQDLATSAEYIATCTKNSLLRCSELEIENLSFPSIGTGVGGFPLGECAEIMIGAAAAHVRTHEFPKLVEFVLRGKEAYTAFATVLSRLGGSEEG